MRSGGGDFKKDHADQEEADDSTCEIPATSLKNCVDSVGNATDAAGRDSCIHYSSGGLHAEGEERCGESDDLDFIANDLCCACGGGDWETCEDDDTSPTRFALNFKCDNMALLGWCTNTATQFGDLTALTSARCRASCGMCRGKFCCQPPWNIMPLVCCVSCCQLKSHLWWCCHL